MKNQLAESIHMEFNDNSVLSSLFGVSDSNIHLLEKINNVKIEYRGNIVKISGNKLSIQVETEARNYFKDKVYNTVIPRNVRLSEAPSHGIPVLIYDKKCSGSKSYFNFTNEFISQDKFLESAA